MVLHKGQKLKITGNHHVTERNGVHHCFKIGEIVTVSHRVDTEEETPLCINKQGIGQFVKKDCFKLL